jgi:hypothetical protein
MGESNKCRKTIGASAAVSRETEREEEERVCGLIGEREIAVMVEEGVSRKRRCSLFRIGKDETTIGATFNELLGFKVDECRLTLAVAKNARMNK